MTELLQDYREFLLPVTAKDKELLFDSEGSLMSLFYSPKSYYLSESSIESAEFLTDVIAFYPGFVKHAADRTSSAFYAALVSTQLWADFVRDLNCISERTGELEAFDTAIANLRLARAKGGSRPVASRSRGRGSGGRVNGSKGLVGASSESIGGETCSQVSSGSGGDAGSAASVPLNGSCSSPRDSISVTEGSSLGGQQPSLTELPKILQPPQGLLEMDPLCADIPFSQFTWTRPGFFPETVNATVLDELCHRLWRLAADAPTNTPPFESVRGKSDIENEEDIFRFIDDAEWSLSDGVEDFSPPPNHLPPSFSLRRGNGVPEALGLSRLNSLLKRTQQETTDCLIAGRSSFP